MMITPKPRNYTRGAMSIGRLAGDVTTAAFKRHGLVHSEIINAWEEIAGAELAGVSRPLRLAWPRSSNKPSGNRIGATLTIAIEGPRAIEIQHAANHIMDYINTLLGYRAVSKIRLVQETLSRPKKRPAPAPVQPVAADRLTGIRSEALRNALARLGESTTRQEDQLPPRPTQCNTGVVCKK
jgi:hypothetical protein